MINKFRIAALVCCLATLSLFSQDDGTAYSQMYSSIITNDLDKLARLIGETQDINSVEWEGHHVFESVFVMQNCTAAEQLLSAGFDLDYENIEGKTMRDLIMETNNKTLIKLIGKYE